MMSSVAAEARDFLFAQVLPCIAITEALVIQAGALLAAWFSRSPVTCNCSAGSCHHSISAAIEPFAEELRRCRSSCASDPAPCPSCNCDCPASSCDYLHRTVAAWLVGFSCGVLVCLGLWVRFRVLAPAAPTLTLENQIPQFPGTQPANSSSSSTSANAAQIAGIVTPKAKKHGGNP